MATHSSIPAWEIPRAEEPGGPQCTGLQTVGHSYARTHCLFPLETKPAFPVFPGGEFQAGLKASAWSMCLHLGWPPTLKAEESRSVPSHTPSGWQSPGRGERDFALGGDTPASVKLQLKGFQLVGHNIHFLI